MISEQTNETRISGVYSEVARTDRDSSSPPTANPADSPTTRRSMYSVPVASGSQQRGAVLRRVNPRVSNGGTMETLSTTVEYTADSSTEAQASPEVPTGGGYVWPLPFAAPEYNEPPTVGEGSAVRSGEYVGPFYRRFTAPPRGRRGD